MQPRAKLALILTIGVLASGCYSTTRIYSKPTDADVVMDRSKSLGTTPVELEEQVWLWTSHAITVRKEGYGSRTIQIKSEGVNFAYLAVCVCTLGLLLPIMFASEYPQQYVVELQPSTPEAEKAELREDVVVSFRE